MVCSYIDIKKQLYIVKIMSVGNNIIGNLRPTLTFNISTYKLCTTTDCTFSILMFPVHDWLVSPTLLHRYYRSLISIICGLLTGGRLPTTGNCWIAKIGISVLLFAKCEYSVLSRNFFLFTVDSCSVSRGYWFEVLTLQLIRRFFCWCFKIVLKLWCYSVFSYSLLL